MKKTLLTLFAAMAFIASCSAPAGNDETGTADAVENTIMERRSIRKYTDQAVDRELLDQILKCGINAPNGQGRQAYEVRVVDSPALLKEMSDAAGGTLFFNAPCVVFIANDTSYDMSQVDCGLLGENIILSAWSHGIGSCCLARPVRQMKTAEACRPYIERMGFSDGYELLYCISLGYPDEAPAAKPRKTEKVQFVEP